MNKHAHRAASAATVAALLGALSMTGAAAQAAALPPLQHDASVAYLTGGVGKDESTAIERASAHWPLTLEFAVRDRQHADFAADVGVVVRDAQGRVALRATAGGPFLLARLAPGTYSVEATLAGKTLHENVAVASDKPARAVFVWPSGTNES